jgi:tetratricopeptide (TPR) repeat protein
MKLWLLFICLFSGFSWADPRTLVHREQVGPIDYSTQGLFRMRGKLNPPPDAHGQLEMNPQLLAENRTQQRVLRQVKYHLINGETNLAKLYLTQHAYLQSPLKAVIYRYLGLINFLEGRFAHSLEHLSRPELNAHFAKVCLLKTLNRIALNMRHELEEEWNTCKADNPRHFNADNLRWMDTLVQLKVSPAPGITKIPFERVRLAALGTAELKILMKLSLYLNQEHMLADQMFELSLHQMQDSEVREIAGQILFRTGSLANAYRFIEDIRSPNVENIKGNLYVLRHKFELAYAQFKLALEQKQNSQNALERLLPLAWLLGDWENGAKYAERVMASPQTQIHKLALSAAFKIQQGKFDEALKLVDRIWYQSPRGVELEVTQLTSFAALMKNDQHLMRKNAELSCKRHDLVNCWLQFQALQWGAFPVTVRREDAPVIKKMWEHLSQESLNEPLKEIVYVNQIDIEEMDDKQIQLIPASP